MGWHEFLMKHGMGSPGYIAKTMAKQYQSMRATYPSEGYRSVLRRLLASRVTVQSSFGGPKEYREIRQNFELIDSVIDANPNLFKIIRFAILVEHPELRNPFAPANRFEILDRVITEILNRDFAEWKLLPESCDTLTARARPLVSGAEAPNNEVPSRSISVRPRAGDSVDVALRVFTEACKEPGTLFITDEWIKPRFDQLEAFLTDPIASEEADSLCDAIEKRANLDYVIEWLAQSELPWREFNSLKQDFEKREKVLRTASERIEYDRKRLEAERVWRTKANTPWEAAMLDPLLQSKHDSEPIKREYGHMARPCPQCGAMDLRWFYYIQPPHPYDMSRFKRFAGWVTACKKCNEPVDYLGPELVLRARARGKHIMF